jgi:hypothetical protein
MSNGTIKRPPHQHPKSLPLPKHALLLGKSTLQLIIIFIFIRATSTAARSSVIIKCVSFALSPRRTRTTKLKCRSEICAHGTYDVARVPQITQRFIGGARVFVGLGTCGVPWGDDERGRELEE